jgi:hypothetical protein
MPVFLQSFGFTAIIFMVGILITAQIIRYFRGQHRETDHPNE